MPLFQLTKQKTGTYEPTQKYFVKNLGAGINSEESDYFPSITADESMLLFTSIRDGSLGGKIDGKKMMKIYGTV